MVAGTDDFGQTSFGLSHHSTTHSPHGLQKLPKLSAFYFSNHKMGISCTIIVQIYEEISISHSVYLLSR